MTAPDSRHVMDALRLELGDRAYRHLYVEHLHPRATVTHWAVLAVCDSTLRGAA